jgi:hypothetical protein
METTKQTKIHTKTATKSPKTTIETGKYFQCDEQANAVKQAKYQPKTAKKSRSRRMESRKESEIIIGILDS